MNLTLFRKRILVDVIKLRFTWLGSKSNDKYHERQMRQKYKGWEGFVKTEAETVAMKSEIVLSRILIKGKDFPLLSLGAFQPLILDCQLAGLWENKFCVVVYKACDLLYQTQETDGIYLCPTENQVCIIYTPNNMKRMCIAALLILVLKWKNTFVKSGHMEREA